MLDGTNQGEALAGNAATPSAAMPGAASLGPAILGDDARGAQAPADGNAVDPALRGGAQSASGMPLPNAAPSAAAAAAGLPELGPNNERLETIAPRLVNALRELVTMYREVRTGGAPP